MSSRKNGPIYTGVTSQLLHRVYQHRNGLTEGFTRRYNCRRLVWFELHELIAAAIQREKRLKKYPRQWKVNLIETENPDWEDLWDRIARA
ncbi:GIY-YIG nuclease family protein [Hyphobacterium sp. Y6023]|uniref:GIY-YIG nuclease family protein n=2 Tax=Hyphobacterium marinum TaxID=3116574 RepID=A0ABU7LYT4_9PROT|nr:GIY-YIG nuclease family protein [Hyphobacterium sp. Y6023]